MQFSVLMELHEKCMISIFGQPGHLKNSPPDPPMVSTNKFLPLQIEAVN